MKLMKNRSKSLAKSHLKNISSAYNVPSIMTKHSFLYEDAKKRQEFQNIILNEPDPDCTFKPNIENSQRRVRSKSPILHNCNHAKTKPKKLFHDEEETFKPKIGRPPKIDRNPTGKKIGVYLDDLAKQIAASRKMQQKEENEKIEQIRNEPKVNENTEKLAKQRRFDAYKETFNLLDPNGEGIISPSKIDLTRIFSFIKSFFIGISPKLLEIYSPLLCEMEELNQPLNFEDFSLAADRLYHTLNPAEKDIMVHMTIKNHNKEIPNSETNFTFKVFFNEFIKYSLE